MSNGGEPDELTLVASLGDPSRFAEIFERRVDGIYRYLSVKAGEGPAEELTAEVFAQAFAQRRRFDPDRGSVRAWLYGIATNLARHHHRDEARRMVVVGRTEAEPAAVVSDRSGQIADRLRLTEALGALNPAWRDVVLLVGLADLTYQETAQVLRIPVGTVRSRYARARAHLVSALEEPGLAGGAVP